MPYMESCNYCNKKFKKPHCAWYICIECHKENQSFDCPKANYKQRLRDKEELI